MGLTSSGYGDGSGYGYGDGYGSGYGYGYGSGSGEIELPQENAWMAYHYIRKTDKGFVLRNGRAVRPNDILRESQIKMCECGLHASLSVNDAKIYRPYHSVLTRVLIWGRIIVGKDKLVATHRQLIGEVPE